MEYKISKESDAEIDFGEMPNHFFLIGILNEFMNRFQTAGDQFFDEISWKQCFTLICIQFFTTPPTLSELSELLGSSHQNIKQMLLKLEKVDFVHFIPDDKDKRKQRIILTDKAKAFSEKNDAPSAEYMAKLFEGVSDADLLTTIRTIMQLDEKLKKMGGQ